MASGQFGPSNESDSRRDWARGIDLLPAVLGVAGWLALAVALLSSDGLRLPELAVVAFWGVVVYVVSQLGYFVRPRAIRIICSVCLAAASVLLTWEGGLFFLPAALALLLKVSVRPSPPAPQDPSPRAAS